MSIWGFFAPRGRPTAALALPLATGVPGADETDDAPPDAVETSSSAMQAAAAQADVSTGAAIPQVCLRGALMKTEQKTADDAVTDMKHYFGERSFLEPQQKHRRPSHAFGASSHESWKSPRERRKRMTDRRKVMKKCPGGCST
jgi:hypothetical protein